MNSNPTGRYSDAYYTAERRIRKETSFSEAFFKNPITSTAAGVCIIAGAAVSFANALIICGTLLILLPLLCLFSAIENKRINQTLRPAVLFAVSAVIVFGISLALNALYPDGVQSMGIFLPLMSAGGIAICATSLEKKNLAAGEALGEGFASALCCCAVALPVGFLREIFGAGSFLGFELGFKGIELITSPGAGFILCGIALAVLNAAKRTDARNGGERR